MSLTCRQLAELLIDYVSGELPPEQEERLRQHLDACPPCLDAYDFEADLRAVVSKRCRDRVPPELQQRIAEAIRQMQE